MLARFHPQSISWLSITISLLALALLASACVKRARTPLVATNQYAGDLQSASSSQAKTNQTRVRININTASAKELETLPGIGKSLAERIIEHRERYGSFRSPEHLIIVRGISDKRFRALRDLVTVE